MLRRLTVCLRRRLFVVGVVLMVWWPFSYFTGVWLHMPGAYFSSSYGLAGVEMVLDKRQGRTPPSIGAAPAADNPWSTPHLRRWRPHFEHNAWPAPGRYIAYLYLPLWLLAVICLAWPVTSFFLARRRQGRGFAVETTEGVKEEG